MASDFLREGLIKQLAVNERVTREKAVEFFTTLLSSGRPFTDLELLQLWKGLYYCMYHQDKPIPQQNLCQSLAAMLQSLPQTVFITFLSAFWTTIAGHYSNIPSLRLDKYLLLIRMYVANSFEYLAAQEWPEELLKEYLDLLKKIPFSLDTGDGLKVPYGLRYHVLDVWIDGISGCSGVDVDRVMEPVENLRKIARSKVLRTRAKDVLADERLHDLRTPEDVQHNGPVTENDEEFAGFD